MGIYRDYRVPEKGLGVWGVGLFSGARWRPQDNNIKLDEWPHGSFADLLTEVYETQASGSSGKLRRPSKVPLLRIWEFPKIGVPYLGVLIIRVLLFRVLY